MKNSMTSKERYLTAIKMEGIPDRVPVFDNLCNKEIYRATLGVEPQPTAKEIYAATLVLGLDAAAIPYRGASNHEIKHNSDGAYTDEWGAVIKGDDVSWPCPYTVQFPINDRSDFKKMKPPDPDRPERYEDITEIVKMNKNRIALEANVGGPVTCLWSLMQPEKILLNMYDDPGFIKDLFRMANEFTIPLGINAIKAGVDYIQISEDLASNQNTYFSLETYRELVHPFLEEIVKEFRKVKKDLPIVFHCCGNFKLFIEDYISLGINAINPFQITAGWDIKEVKQKYGDRVCIVGGVDSTRTLSHGTPEDVRKETIEAIESAKTGGGFVLSSDHSLHQAIPMDNIWAMINTAQKYGYY